MYSLVLLLSLTYYNFLFLTYHINFQTTLTELFFVKCLVGFFYGNRDDCKLINHLLILGKQTIFYCRQKKLLPLFSLFQLRVQRVIEIEKIIATSRNKLLVHLTKWEKVLSFVNS